MDKSLGYYELKISEGQIVPLKFGIYALERFSASCGVDLAGSVHYVLENLKTQPQSLMTEIIFAGAQNYAKYEETGARYRYKDVVSWVETLGVGSESISEAFQSFLGSILPPQELSEADPVEEDEIDKAKKKGKKSSVSA